MIADSRKFSRVLKLILSFCLVAGQLKTNQWPAFCNGLPEPGKIVTLNSLPEPFSDDKLPSPGKPDPEKSACFDYLGCFERIPVSQWPKLPEEMDFQVRLLRGTKEELIKYEPTEHCEPNSDNCITYPFRLNNVRDLSFDPKLRTIVVIGGYLSHEIEDWQQSVQKIWSKLGPANLMVVAWHGGNSGLYPAAVANSRLVARQATVFLYYLALAHNMDIKSEIFNGKFHFIGHSLGAHISGFVGKDLDGMIGRITGLDPAGPNFVNLDRHLRLDRLDAKLVDVLHTNGGDLSLVAAHFGLAAPIGHLDYYANDGQHQPNCNIDALGCSHNTAKQFFLAFLNHELYMTEHLDPDKMSYILKNRVFAYRSDSFQEFKNGSSFSKNCPVSSLDDDDINLDDIDSCVIPIDFVAPPEMFRDELSKNYGISFDPNETQINTFYLYTNPDKPYISHHNIVRVRVSKPKNTKVHECDLNFVIKTVDGYESSHTVNGYELVDQGDHYEVLLPYVSPNTASHFALADLDINDFYIDDHSKLYQAIDMVLPKSIVVKGLIIGDVDPNDEEASLVDAFEKFFGFGQASSEEQHYLKHKCDFKVVSVMIRPIKRLHRYLSATYTVEARDLRHPELAFLFDKNSSTPKSSVKSGGTRNTREERDETRSEAYIKTVVIGPKNELPEEANFEITTEAAGLVEVTTIIGEEHSEIDLFEKGKSWYRVSLFGSMIGVLVIIVVAIKILSHKGWLPEHRRALIS